MVAKKAASLYHPLTQVILTFCLLCLFAAGYHLLVFLDDEYSLADVYDFAADLRSDYAEFGLERQPEIFPPKRAVEFAKSLAKIADIVIFT